MQKYTSTANAYVIVHLFLNQTLLLIHAGMCTFPVLLMSHCPVLVFEAFVDLEEQLVPGPNQHHRHLDRFRLQTCVVVIVQLSSGLEIYIKVQS